MKLKDEQAKMIQLFTGIDVNTAVFFLHQHVQDVRMEAMVGHHVQILPQVLQSPL